MRVVNLTAPGALDLLQGKLLEVKTGWVATLREELKLQALVSAPSTSVSGGSSW